jgi:hypothetical protein
MAEPRGIVRTGDLVSIVAAGTSTALYTVSTGRSVQAASPTTAGAAPFVLRRMWVYSRQANTITLTLGELVAAAFTQRLPLIDILPSMLYVFGEGSIQPIPYFRFTSTLYAQASAAGASPNDVQVLVEVIEYPAHILDV